MSNPVLYLGQSSVQIGIETDRLCRQEKLLTAPSVFADSRACYGGSKTSIPVLDISMPHLFAYPSGNSATVESIVSRLLRKMEACDNPSSVGIVADMCSGLGSSLSSAILAELKDLAPHLRLHSVFAMPPHDTVQGINVLNGVMTLQMSMEYADSVIVRGFDDAMDLVSEHKQQSSAPASLQESHAAIAADLYLALGPKRVSCGDALLHLETKNVDIGAGMGDNSVYSSRVGASEDIYGNYSTSFSSPDTGLSSVYCWPSGNCSTGAGKLCDVRSSLWRLHDMHLRAAARKNGSSRSRGSTGVGAKAKAENYNPIRALAANMHCLHLASGRVQGEESSYNNNNSSNSSSASGGFELDVCVQSATLARFGTEPTLHVPVAGQNATTCRRMVISPDNTEGGACLRADSSEVARLLSWACPGMTFPHHLGKHTYRDHISGQTVKLGKSQNRNRRHAGGVSNISAMSQDSSSSSFQEASSRSQSFSSRRGASEEGNAESPDIAAIAFSSPYARNTAKQVCSKAQELFNRKAYIARYADVGVEELDFELSLNYLSEQLLS